MSITPAQCPGTAAPGTLVQPPAISKYAYGAMSAFSIIEETDDHVRNGAYYKSPFCAGVNTFEDVCSPDVPDPKTPTDVDQNSVVSGCPFNLYSYLSCRTTTLEQMLVDARIALDVGEQRGVEENVWNLVVATASSTVINASSLAADALGFLAGVAALESAIAECYGGQATLHADRGMAAYAADNMLLERQGGSAFTPLGSRWAFYAGAPNTGPTGAAAPAGHTWIYATSQITLRRFPVIAPDSVDHLLQYPTNEPVVIAERTYVPTRECCAFAVLVCLSTCD